MATDSNEIYSPPQHFADHFDLSLILSTSDYEGAAALGHYVNAIVCVWVQGLEGSGYQQLKLCLLH
jgi:hypothetical protein